MAEALDRRRDTPSGRRWFAPSGGPTAVALSLAVAALATGSTAGSPRAPADAPSTAGVAVPAARHGLSTLPAAARSVVSAALGGESPGFSARRSPGGYRLDGGGVAADLDAGGIALRAGGVSLSMTVAGVGRGRSLDRLRVLSVGARANRVSLERRGVTEWYAAGPLGIEQGFTLTRRPAGRDRPVTLTLKLGGEVRARQDRSGTVFLTRPGQTGLSYGALSAIDANGRPLRAALELRDGELRIRVWDGGARYPVLIDPLIQQGDKLTANDETDEGFGYSVALSADGNTALIGGYHGFTHVGAAWVFTRSGGVWTQQGPKLKGSGEVAGPFGGSRFGISVALSADGNTALIGGTDDDHLVGAAWVFTRSGTTWTQQGAKLTGSDEAGQGFFGIGVALSADGSSALIGGLGDSNGVGAAWVFTRSGGVWTQQGAKLTGSGATTNSWFGWSVALSANGSTALIGGPGVAGGAWAFVRSGTTWTQQGDRLTGGGQIGEAGFGGSVALSSDGNTALVGGPGDDNVGAAWVFTRSAAIWTQQGSKLTVSGETGVAAFGVSGALSSDGNTALIGSLRDNLHLGTVWTFTRSGSTWTQHGDKLTGGFDLGGSGVFGGPIVPLAVSGDGNTALIGGAADSAGVGAAWVYAPAPSAALYWANTAAATVGRANLDGSGANQSLVGGANLPRGVAFNGRYVYWANGGNGTIGRANLDGTGANQSFIGGANSPAGVAVDGSHVYWSNSGGGTIGRANLDGTGVNQSFVSGASSPAGVAVDGSHVYWASSGNNTIGRANLDGSSPDQSFVTGAHQPIGVAVDASHLYWSNSGNGTIGRALLAGTSIDQGFVGGAVSPHGIAVAGQYVYWTDVTAGSDTIGRALLSTPGSPDQSFVTGANDPWGLAARLTVPWPPTGVSAVAGDGGATVRFTAPGADGGAAIGSFTATASPGGATASGTSSPITVPGLANGTPYTFTVTATSAVGTSAASSPSSPVIPAMLPGAPTGVTATPGDGQASVRFFAPPDTGSPITSYTVTAAPGGATASGQSDPIVVSGLANGTTYTFTVTATNIVGTGPASAPSSPLLVAARPGAPSGASAVAGNGFAIVSFAAPSSNGGAPITAYIASATGFAGPGASGPSSPIVVTGLTNGTTYTFEVRAVNSSGFGAASAPSNPVTPTAGATWAQQGGKLAGAGRFGSSVAVSSNGSTALIGAQDDNDGVGAAWVYVRSGAVWTQQGPKLTGSDATGVRGFGFTVALSADGNTALVGGPGDVGDAGAAWVFTRSGGVWTQQGPKLTGSGAFGFAVAVSADGNTALIGGPDGDDGAGSAWVFTRDGGNWSQQGAKLAGDGASGPGGFGWSVALSDDGGTALIGGPFDDIDNEFGAVWTFTRAGATWTQQGAKLTGNALAQWYGWTVALSGDGSTALIGSYPIDSTMGQAVVMTRSGSVWSFQANLVYTDAISGSYFGFSVSLSRNGNTAVVGGPTDDADVGAGWVFTRVGGIWRQQGARLVGGGEAGAGAFGYDVALSSDGKTALIGGPDDNDEAGAAWAFALPATAPGTPANVLAVADDARAALSWLEPASDGGAPITGYVVTPFAGSVAQAPIPVGTLTGATVTGLTNDTSYTFTVAATNAVGSGPASVASNAVTPNVQGREPPDPPAETRRPAVPEPPVTTTARPPRPPGH